MLQVWILPHRVECTCSPRSNSRVRFLCCFVLFCNRPNSQHASFLARLSQAHHDSKHDKMPWDPTLYEDVQAKYGGTTQGVAVRGTTNAKKLKVCKGVCHPRRGENNPSPHPLTVHNGDPDIIHFEFERFQR